MVRNVLPIVRAWLAHYSGRGLFGAPWCSLVLISSGSSFEARLILWQVVDSSVVPIAERISHLQAATVLLNLQEDNSSCTKSRQKNKNRATPHGSETVSGGQILVGSVRWSNIAVAER